MVQAHSAEGSGIAECVLAMPRWRRFAWAIARVQESSGESWKGLDQARSAEIRLEK